jgi:serine/threonine protein kinase
VEEVETFKEMAIKVMKVENKEIVEREIAVGLTIAPKSKYLVKVTEVFKIEDYCCLVMELCTGGTLEALLKNKMPLHPNVFFFFFLCYDLLFIENLKSNEGRN